MKSFLRTFFFLDNPRLGVFVMATITAVVYCLVLPPVLYVLFLVPSRVITMQGVEHSFFVWRGLKVLFVLYTLVVVFNCVGQLLRETFSPHPKHPFVRAFIGMLIVSLTFLVCAVRQRRFIAGIASLVALIFQVLPLAMLGRWPGYVQDACALAGAMVAFFALYLLRCGRPVKVTWLMTLCLIPLVSCAGLYWFTAVSRAEAEREVERYHHTAGFSMTLDDFKADFATNGVPISSEPYASVFSPTNGVEHWDRKAWWEFIEPRPLTPEEFGFYDAFTASNRTYLVAVDAVTAKPIPKLAHDTSEWLRYPTHELSMWMEYYAARLVVAAKRGDTATVMETSQRLGHIRDALWQSPTLPAAQRGMHAEYQRAMMLSHSLEQVPDGLLLHLQRELVKLPETVRERLNVFYMFLFGMTENKMATLKDEEGRTFARASLPVYLLWDAWMYQERLAYCTVFNEYVAILRDPTLTGQEREAHCQRLVDKDLQRNRLGFSLSVRMIYREREELTWIESVADVYIAGFAVERYRKKHGRLPETLDELVPEFLDKPPLSSYDNTPLKYERGALEWRRRDGKIVPYHGYSVSARQPFTFAAPLADSAPAAEAR